DHGIGIPESEQQEIFKRFYRAENATNIQGTGLGLNIVKKYLTLLNGTIEFKSKVNEGTTFTVHIPVEVVKENQKDQITN
ncbi:MAG TPA: sensor histidine kinase, partial [Chryseosolibacter sp.]